MDTVTVPTIPSTSGRLDSGFIGDDSGGPKSLYQRLVGLGVMLSDDDGRLAIDAPAGVLSDGLVEAIQFHREALLAQVDVPSDPVESLGLGPGWVCPWCRSGDRLAPAEPEGLRCQRCDRLAFRFVGDAIERADWVEPVLLDATDPPKDNQPKIAPEPRRNRGSAVDRAACSLFIAIDEPG